MSIEDTYTDKILEDGFEHSTYTPLTRLLLSSRYFSHKKISIKMDILNTIIILFSTPLILLLLTFSFLTLRIFTGKSLNNPEYPPVRGTVFSLLFHFNSLYDYLTTIAAKDSTFRILLPSSKSFIYTTEPRNIEHVLKTSFDKYSKGENSREIMADLFGKGIFLSDGEEWRHQKKLASYEFSTRVLRDFSCCVFRRNAAKLVRVVSGFEGRVFDMQVSHMK